MKINCMSEEYNELCISNLNVGDIFKTYVFNESVYTYIKIDPIVCRGTTLNAVCLDDGSILSIEYNIRVVPYEGELNLKRKI